jgi:phosphoglycolate phosphatase
MSRFALELAVLDMAGTTVNEHGCVERAFRAGVESVGGPPPDAKSLHQMRGRAKRDVFRELLEHPQQADAAHAHFIQFLLDAVAAGELDACLGAEAALRSLRESGIRTCLITGFDPEIQQALMEQLGWTSLVDLAISPGDELRGRPFPDMILEAMLRLQVTDVHAVLVAGDTVNDLLAGYRAGAGTLVGVLGGAHTREELLAAPHTHLVDGIGHLFEAIR